MPPCELTINKQGAKCGRVAGVERVPVTGPGFRFPEKRWACARCRGEEVVLQVPVAVPGTRYKPRRPLCTVCEKRERTPCGLCYGCRNTLSNHARDFPNRLPQTWSLTHRALMAVNLEIARTYKHGAVILRMREQIAELAEVA